MPLPTPNNEDKNTFISRCMSDDMMNFLITDKIGKKLIGEEYVKWI